MERVAGAVLSLLRSIYRFLSRRAKTSLQYIFSFLRIHAKLGSSKSPPTIFDGAHGTAQNPRRIDIAGLISSIPLLPIHLDHTQAVTYKGAPTAAGTPNMDTPLTAPIDGDDSRSSTPISTHYTASGIPSHVSAEAGLRSSCEYHPLATSSTQDCGGNDQSSTSIYEDALQHLSQHGSASSANVNHDPIAPAPPTIRSDQDIVGAATFAPNVFPMFPSDNTRYSNDRLIDRESVKTFKVRRDMDWSDGNLPAGWEKIVSEDGYPYFRHAEYRVVTDVNLYHEKTSALIVKFIQDIQDVCGTNYPPRQADEVYLVLQLKKLDATCGYYYTDYQKLTVFWHEDEVDITHKLQGICGQPDKPSLIKLLLESEFWTHWALYANIVMPTSSTMNYVENCIRNAQTDVLSSNASTINFDPDDLSRRMNILQEAKEGIVGTDWNETPVNERPTTWFIGRFMASLVFERYINYYGQYHVRLNRKKSVFKRTTLNVWLKLLRLITPSLSRAPDTLYERRELWTDRATYCVTWKKDLQGLDKESKHQMIYSSLLLTSNIAFLAIPTVADEEDKTSRAWAQVPSYASTMFSIASLSIGLLLSRRHQIHNLSHAGKLGSWFKQHDRKTVLLEPLVFMYNVSYLLFLWGIVSFLAAFVIMCFDRVAVATLAIGLVGFFSIMLAWLRVNSDHQYWYITRARATRSNS